MTGARRGATAGREGDRSLARAWCAYNWADHGWATPVAAVLIGPWLLDLADNAVGKHGVLLAVGPVALRADAFPSAMVAVAAVAQLLVLPGLGARIDARAAKRRGLAGACAVGVVVCVALGLTSRTAWLAAAALFVVGSVAEGVSDLTWQGMLPEIAGPDERDALSARGTAVGYLGAGVILALDLALVDLHGHLGMSKATAVRLCFVTCGAWWLAFALPALRRLRPPPRRAPGRPGPLSSGAGGTWARLRADLRTLSGMPQAARYVVAYLCFGDATSAVVSLASIFLTHELFGDDTTRATPFLFELILLIQFIAMASAVVTGRLAARVGAKRLLVASLVLWSAVIIYAWAALRTQTDAVVAGAVIGVGLGATTSLARSLFAQMVPAGMEATFFSLYEVCNQGTAFVAPLLFTIVVDVTGSFRQAILSLIALFVIGLVLLARTDTSAAAAEAEAVGAGRRPPVG